MSGFKRKQLVEHVKTGGVYRIVHTPATCRLEHSNEPAYAYRLFQFRDGAITTLDILDAPLWVRSQSEMEDGRFVALAPATTKES